MNIFPRLAFAAVTLAGLEGCVLQPLPPPPQPAVPFWNGAPGILPLPPRYRSGQPAPEPQPMICEDRTGKQISCTP